MNLLKCLKINLIICKISLEPIHLFCRNLKQIVNITKHVHIPSAKTHTVKQIPEYTVLKIYVSASGTDAGECCSAYTDLQGVYHDAMLCDNYCCFDLSISNAKKTCCDNILREVPQDQRQDDCVNDWIQQHMYVQLYNIV